VVTCPVAHHDGNYFADAETLKSPGRRTARVVFRYAEGTNPNGAINDIAGIMNEQGNVIGMMPHPENMIEPLHGSARLQASVRKPGGLSPQGACSSQPS
jgi:phosphoribosylformylglycinamidine (FGAM) synthase-like amidotransferase family enzyme